MRVLAFWMAWLGIGLTIAGTLAFGMEQWQLTAYPVDEAAAVEFRAARRPARWHCHQNPTAEPK